MKANVLVTGLALATVGGVGMWSVVVVLPAVQADFHISRADASLAYTLNTLGFGFGGALQDPASKTTTNGRNARIVERW